MSVARGYGLNGKSLYANITKPMYTAFQFTVAATDTGGLGITSLKSNGFVESVFMHTSSTPGAVNGITNPNPPSGYALVRFKNNFNYWLNGYQVQYPPATSTGTTSTTINSVYVITALGTATAAQWAAVGLPAGITAAVGQVFVATASQSIGGSATVGVPGVPVAPIVSIVGNPNATIANSNIAVNAGAQVMLQFATPTFTAGAYTPAGTVAAPTFTGSALGTHVHNFTVIGGQAGSTTNDIANYAGPLLGKEQATDATYLGVDSATRGGVVPVSAGTPAGTNSAPAFTGTAASLTGTLAYVATAPAAGTIVYMQLCYDGSSVTIDGI